MNYTLCLPHQHIKSTFYRHHCHKCCYHSPRYKKITVLLQRHNRSAAATVLCHANKGVQQSSNTDDDPLALAFLGDAIWSVSELFGASSWMVHAQARVQLLLLAGKLCCYHIGIMTISASYCILHFVRYHQQLPTHVSSCACACY